MIDVVDKSIGTLQAAMAAGDVTSQELVQAYLERIDRYQPTLRAAVSTNVRALAEAGRLDRERAAGVLRGPLHGIPIAVKDVIPVDGIRTTLGAVAFEGFVAPFEAEVSTRLQEGGAIIVAKTTLTELANWMATGMPDGYNAVVGHSRNPYDPRTDPRQTGSDGRGVLNPGGSSSGVGTAASLWAASVGTETSGSILIPSTWTMLVGVKPTRGRIDCSGVMPIVAEQDTVGPMARTVADAATVLSVMEGGAPHSARVDMGESPLPPPHRYAEALDRDALVGARIGVPRAYFYEPVAGVGGKEQCGGLVTDEEQVLGRAIAALVDAGAKVIDPVLIPSVVDTNPKTSFLSTIPCAGEQRRGHDGECSTVMKYGMKRDFNRWLASFGDASPVATLAELRSFNVRHEHSRGTMLYGQAVLDACDEMDLDRDRGRFTSDRATDVLVSRTHGLDAALDQHGLDALLFPGWYGELIAAKAGYPSVAVPFGFVPSVAARSVPTTFEPKDRPFGVAFTGRPWSERQLIALAYAFEVATAGRRAPAGFE